MKQEPLSVISTTCRVDNALLNTPTTENLLPDGPKLSATIPAATPDSFNAKGDRHAAFMSAMKAKLEGLEQRKRARLAASGDPPNSKFWEDLADILLEPVHARGNATDLSSESLPTNQSRSPTPPIEAQMPIAVSYAGATISRVPTPQNDAMGRGGSSVAGDTADQGDGTNKKRKFAEAEDSWRA